MELPDAQDKDVFLCKMRFWDWQQGNVPDQPRLSHVCSLMQVGK